MSVRRPRPSTGPVGTQVPAKASFSALDAFEDFRRRHSKQNKDIIVDNALRRTTIANLQEEVAKLHIEVLQLRETNIQLSNQVRRLQTQPGRGVNDSTRAAIDQILAAIPTLQYFRQNLDSSVSPISDQGGDLTTGPKAWMIESTENPTATRPAATGGDFMRLLTLEEATEYGSDVSMSDAELKGVTLPKNRRTSELGSVPVPRSPRPIANRPAPSDYFVVTTPPPTSTSPIGSPSSSRSPSPVKTAKSPSKEKKQKRRRESGFQLPQARERSTTPPEVDQLSQIPDWEEGRSVVIAPPPKTVTAPAASKQVGRSALGLSADNTNKAKPSAVPASKARIVTPIPQGVAASAKAGKLSSGVARSEGEDTLTAPAVASVRPKTAPKAGRTTEEEAREMAEAAAVPSVPDEATLDSVPTSEAAFLASLADDEGGRVRRARKSVNYKEPNLTKKMRKPDGIAIEDTLRAPRSSTSSTLSALDIPTPLSTASSTSKRTLSHTTGPRRKSVLPRTAIARSRVEESDDDDDMDLRRELAGIEADLAGRRRAASHEDAGEVITVDTSPPSTATASSWSPPSGATQPSSASSSTSEYAPYMPPSRSTVNPAPVRTSPRKSQTKRADGLGVGRPSSTTTGAVSRSASGSRMALGDRPAENGQRTTSSSSAGAAGSLATSIGKAGTTVKRPAGAAARRASSIV